MWLEEAELYHYKARAYDPQLGRFLQADPIGYGDGLNMYAYVGGDAVNYRDPSGMAAICEGLITTIYTLIGTTIDDEGNPVNHYRRSTSISPACFDEISSWFRW